jgi:hypothetical protein
MSSLLIVVVGAALAPKRRAVMPGTAAGKQTRARRAPAVDACRAGAPARARALPEPPVTAATTRAGARSMALARSMATLVQLMASCDSAACPAGSVVRAVGATGKTTSWGRDTFAITSTPHSTPPRTLRAPARCRGILKLRNPAAAARAPRGGGLRNSRQRAVH